MTASTSLRQALLLHQEPQQEPQAPSAHQQLRSSPRLTAHLQLHPLPRPPPLQRLPPPLCPASASASQLRRQLPHRAHLLSALLLPTHPLSPSAPARTAAAVPSQQTPASPFRRFPPLARVSHPQHLRLPPSPLERLASQRSQQQTPRRTRMTTKAMRMETMMKMTRTKTTTAKKMRTKMMIKKKMTRRTKMMIRMMRRTKTTTVKRRKVTMAMTMMMMLLSPAPSLLQMQRRLSSLHPSRYQPAASRLEASLSPQAPLMMTRRQRRLATCQMLPSCRPPQAGSHSVASPSTSLPATAAAVAALPTAPVTSQRLAPHQHRHQLLLHSPLESQPALLRSVRRLRASPSAALPRRRRLRPSRSVLALRRPLAAILPTSQQAQLRNRVHSHLDLKRSSLAMPTTLSPIRTRRRHNMIRG